MLGPNIIHICSCSKSHIKLWLTALTKDECDRPNLSNKFTLYGPDVRCAVTYVPRLVHIALPVTHIKAEPLQGTSFANVVPQLHKNRSEYVSYVDCTLRENKNEIVQRWTMERVIRKYGWTKWFHRQYSHYTDITQEINSVSHGEKWK